MRLLIILFAFFTAHVAQADIPIPEKEISVLNFGLDQRFLYRSNHTEANLSTVFSWSPRYSMGNGWVFGLELGAAGMRDTAENFLAVRSIATASYWKLLCWYYPEVYIGGETWTAPNGGAYATYGLNNHFRFLLKPTSTRWLDSVASLIESWVLGYQHINVSSALPADVASIGLRIAF